MRVSSLSGLALALLLAAGVSAASCTSSNDAVAVDAGAPCATDDDCPQDAFCYWPVTGGCDPEDKGSCIVPSTDQSGCIGGPVCPCSNAEVAYATCDGARMAVTGGLGCRRAPCTTDKDCSAGLLCDGINETPSDAASTDATTSDSSPGTDSGAALDAGDGASG
jgi:hypothetical protein